RKVNDVVIRILSSTEYTLAEFQDADHGKKLPLNVQLLTQRLFAREKFFRGIVADNNDRGAALFIDIAEPTAGTQVDVNDVFVRGRVALQNSLLGLTVFVFDGVS